MSRGDFDFESRLAPLMLAYARHRGLDVAPWLEKHALPKDVLTQQPGKLQLVTTASVLPALAGELAQALGDRHFGLSLAEWMPKGAYGVAEFLVRAGPTLRDAFSNFTRFNAIISPSQTFRFEEADGEARLHHFATLRPGVLGRHLGEYSSAVMVRAFRSLAADARPLRAWFIHPRPADADFDRLAAVLGTTDLRFDEQTNGFSVDPTLLGAPVVGGDAALYAFLEEHAVAALESRPKSDDLIDKLRHFIKEALKLGEPNVERLATRLNMSGRTLQRRLSDLKTSFQEVLDLVRFDLARAYLKDARLDLSQIAYLLGYSELRAFDRAFRRWADMSPSEWRSKAA
ncbi:MAG: AraC family transcriptional regulator ligand-binding domain-containing protein [Myxococcota bacterium]